MQGYDGEPKQLQLVKLELYFLDKTFVGEYLLIDRPVGILGRNILQNLRILLDGPRQKWNEQKT